MDYPHWATRELLMNAICHRTYESNGPIQFYQYNDRIELMNPGGLYGKVNAQNFPFVNDYRNPVIAEAMKVLGFVNRFSRGIIRVKEELKENGNGEPEFSLDLGTAFLVVEPISAEALKYYPSEEKSEEKKELSEMEKRVLEVIAGKPSATYAFISDNLGISETSVYNAVRHLKTGEWIKRKEGKKYGSWVVLKKNI